MVAVNKGAVRTETRRFEGIYSDLSAFFLIVLV